MIQRGADVVVCVIWRVHVQVWMKANLLVHPDKVRQRNGSPEQVARADMVFDVLKDAWNTFQSSGK